MACSCKKNTGNVQKVKQVVKKVPSKTKNTEEVVKKKIYKKITYRRPI